MNIEQYILDKDIPVFGVEADSFPEGISAAYQKLDAMLPNIKTRRHFGISGLKKFEGRIFYKACVEELFAGEAEKHACHVFIIQKGVYSSILITNFIQNIPAISAAFKMLLQNPNLDPNGVCVEIIENISDVRCMVKLIGVDERPPLKN